MALSAKFILSIPQWERDEQKNQPAPIDTDTVARDSALADATKTETTDNAWDPKILRGVFAKSLCRANMIGSSEEIAACDNGQPCTKINKCIALADQTLHYTYSLGKDQGGLDVD